MVIPLALAGAALGAGADLLQNRSRKQGIQAALQRLRRQKISHRRSQSQQATSGHLDAMASAGNVTAEAKRGGPLTVDDLAVIQKSVGESDAKMARDLAATSTQTSQASAKAAADLEKSLGEIPGVGATLLKHGAGAVQGLVGGAATQALGQKIDDKRLNKMLRAASFVPGKSYTDAEFADMEVAGKKWDLEMARAHYGRGQ